MVAGISEDALHIGTDLGFEEAYEEIAKFNENVHKWGRPEDFYVEIEGGRYNMDSTNDLDKFLEMAESNDDDIDFMKCNLHGTDHNAFFYKGKNHSGDKCENQVAISEVKGYRDGLVEIEELYHNLSK